MPISRDHLEGAIRSAMPIIHLDIIDQSNGCGENYAVFVVSSVSGPSRTRARTIFSDGYGRLSRARTRWLGIDSVRWQRYV